MFVRLPLVTLALVKLALLPFTFEPLTINEPLIVVSLATVKVSVIFVVENAAGNSPDGLLLESTPIKVVLILPLKNVVLLILSFDIDSPVIEAPSIVPP